MRLEAKMNETFNERYKYNGEQSGGTHVNSSEIHTKSEGRDDASDGQFSDDERTG